MTCRITILAILLLGAGIVGAGEPPRQFAGRFLQALNRWSFRGVPLTEDLSRIEPWFGMEVIRAFRRVNIQRERYHLTFPDKPGEPRRKPPWCPEGDVFTGVWEGMTSYSVGRARYRRGKMSVEAHLEFVQGGESHPWTIQLLLDRAGQHWVVSDIEYAAGEGTMLEGLHENLARWDRKILDAIKAR